MQFSLIQATAGRTEELGRFLVSLSAQSYRDFELIVVDQNPDDRLVPVLDPYTDEFPILHLRSERGLSRARNVGLRLAGGDVVAFPDDDCWYPPDLLERVARFLAEHPERDGLTVRSIDEDGRTSNARFDDMPGLLDKTNIWYRHISYTIFLRKSCVQGVWFDEDWGPGAGTPWGAGEETDYLLQLLKRGASLYYDPDLVVVHSEPLTRQDDTTLHRLYTYNSGMGRAVRKHDFPLWFKACWLLRTLGGLALCAVGLKRTPGIRYRWSIFRGKLQGLLLSRRPIRQGFEPGRQVSKG